MEGKLLQSRDDGLSWQVVATAPQAITTLLVNRLGQVLPFSKEGVLKPVETGAAKP